MGNCRRAWTRRIRAIQAAAECSPPDPVARASNSGVLRVFAAQGADRRPPLFRAVRPGAAGEKGLSPARLRRPGAPPGGSARTGTPVDRAIRHHARAEFRGGELVAEIHPAIL